MKESMTPMTQPAAMPGDESDAPDATSAGYTIELRVDGSGAISVSVEPASEESAAAPSADGSSDGAPEGDDSQSVPNIREAIKLVLQIYQSNGQTQELGADSAEMAKGYGESA